MKLLLVLLFTILSFNINAQTSFPLINGTEQILQDKQYKLDDGIYLYVTYNKYHLKYNDQILTEGKIVIDNETKKPILFMNLRLISSLNVDVETNCIKKCTEINDNHWNLVSINPYDIRTINFSLEGKLDDCKFTNLQVINYLH